MEKNDIKFRIMNINDLDTIKHNLYSDFDSFWTYETLKNELESDLSIYFVATIQNSIVGFAGIKIIFNEAELMNIVIRKDFRHQHIGSLMLEHIINICKNKKINKINLEVNIKNILAINLYKKYNFNQVGLRKKYYNRIDDAILMSYENK